MGHAFQLFIPSVQNHLRNFPQFCPLDTFFLAQHPWLATGLEDQLPGKCRLADPALLESVVQPCAASSLQASRFVLGVVLQHDPGDQFVIE